jgi:spermidine synthase
VTIAAKVSPSVASSATGRATAIGVVATLYAISGSLGLVYEVAFDKYLAYIFGATAYASSAVLVAFMGGLALGAQVAGRIERHVARPLVAYAMAELMIGSFALYAPRIFRAIGSIYLYAVSRSPDSLATISVLRSGLAVLVVLVPAAGMGATLPFLARFVQQNDPRCLAGSRRLARLYALNTLGGAFGSLASAYVIIPSLGLAATMRYSAMTSIGVGSVALVIGWDVYLPRLADAPAPKNDASPRDTADRMPFEDALVLAAASGLLVFGCEVVLVHLLALVIGTSVYAFGLMLAIFLVCLSLGTPVATRLATRLGASAGAFGFAIAGTALLGSLVIWDKLPSLFILLGPVVRSWGAREVTRALAAAIALFVPVVAMGTTFPLVLRAARARTVASDVGRLTVANTLGSIGGSILGGFALLPAFGSQKSLVAIGLLYLGVAVFAMRRTWTSTDPSLIVRGRVVFGFVGLGVLFAVVVPSWDLARLTSGANVYFNDGTVPGGVVERIDEDVHGGVTTIVRGPDGARTLMTNGKFQGNDGKEVDDNRGFSHLPVMFLKQRKRAMVIGLGTGTSTGAALAYEFEQIDAVELSPAIVHGARTTFAPVNGRVLEDPRVHLLLEDGRNVLLVEGAKRAKDPQGHPLYDFIGMQVSSIWFAGAANLYNREFYQLAASRLNRDGVLQQWVQLHHTNRRILASTIATLRDVFPHVLLAATGHQAQLVASMEPLTVTRDRLAELEAIPGVNRILDGRHLDAYVKSILLDTQGIDDFLDDTQVENELGRQDLFSTDQNLYLEYATPKLNVPTADDIPDTLKYLARYRRNDTLPKHLLP